MANKKLALRGGKKVVPEGMVKYWPWVTKEDKEAMYKVIDTGRYWDCMTPPRGEQRHALEKEWAEYVGARYCIAVNSGTAAIHTAVAAAGIQAGDEVIVPAYTFIASATGVIHHNGIPVFVDINPRTYSIDPSKIEEKITEKTKAILPVDLHGLPVDYDKIYPIAKKYNLKIIEDGSQSQGALYKGKKVGSLGDVAGISLNGGKNLSGAEGGVFTTNDEEAYDRAFKLHMFGEVVTKGEERKREYFGLGWNYRYNEIMAAFVRNQLKRLDEMNDIRRKNCEYLTQYLKEIPILELQHIPSDRTHVYFLYSARLIPEKIGIDVDRRKFRDAVLEALIGEGVPMMRGEGVSGPLPLPGHTIFQAKNAYGHGCPWNCPFTRKEIEYRAEDYPEAMKLVEDKICVGHEHGGIAPPNNLELMSFYVEAFQKVLVDNLQEVVGIAKSIQSR